MINYCCRIPGACQPPKYWLAVSCNTKEDCEGWNYPNSSNDLAFLLQNSLLSNYTWKEEEGAVDNDFQQLKPQNNRVLYHLAVGLGGWGNVVRASKCDNIIVKRAPHWLENVSRRSFHLFTTLPSKIKSHWTADDAQTARGTSWKWSIHPMLMILKISFLARSLVMDQQIVFFVWKEKSKMKWPIVNMKQHQFGLSCHLLVCQISEVSHYYYYLWKRRECSTSFEFYDYVVSFLSIGIFFFPSMSSPSLEFSP